MKIEELPYYYSEIEEIEEICKILENEEIEYKKNIEHLKKEITFNFCENEGVKVLAKTYETTLDKNKLLIKKVGRSTATKTKIKELVTKILKEEVPVVINEIFKKNIVYIGLQNIPEEVLKETEQKLNDDLRAFIPSHLILALYINILVFEVFDNYDKTWDDWDSLDLSWDNLENFINEGGEYGEFKQD